MTSSHASGKHETAVLIFSIMVGMSGNYVIRATNHNLVITTNIAFYLHLIQK